MAQNKSAKKRRSSYQNDDLIPLKAAVPQLRSLYGESLVSYHNKQGLRTESPTQQALRLRSLGRSAPNPPGKMSKEKPDESLDIIPAYRYNYSKGR